jgi:hypothetical protein
MKLYKYAAAEERVDVSSVNDAKTFILANDPSREREVYIVEDATNYQVLFKHKRGVCTAEEELAVIRRQTRPNYLPVIFVVLCIVAVSIYAPVNLQTKLVLRSLFSTMVFALEIRSNAKDNRLYLDAKETIASIVANLDEKFEAKGLTRKEHREKVSYPRPTLAFTHGCLALAQQHHRQRYQLRKWQPSLRRKNLDA